MNEPISLRPTQAVRSDSHRTGNRMGRSKFFPIDFISSSSSGLVHSINPQAQFCYAGYVEVMDEYG
jgi:hypothetical protein